MQCTFCKARIDRRDKIMRSDTCPKCGKNLHCCKQCKFYDPHAYNECREVSAERVVDKERANFCDYFLPRGSTRESVNPAMDARRALDALFKK